MLRGPRSAGRPPEGCLPPSREWKEPRSCEDVFGLTCHVPSLCARGGGRGQTGAELRWGAHPQRCQGSWHLCAPPKGLPVPQNPGGDTLGRAQTFS